MNLHHNPDKPAPKPKIKKDNFSCEKCNPQVFFTLKKSLRAHIKRVHDSDKTFKCTQENCRKTFYAQTLLTEHLENYHTSDPNQNPKQCLFCLEIFPTIRGKMEHIYREHKPKSKERLEEMKAVRARGKTGTEKNQNKKEFKCQDCDSVFLTKRRLLIHTEKFHNGGDDDEQEDYDEDGDDDQERLFV
jgi:hypothetical protein